MRKADLYDHFHQVLLCDYIFAIYHLLQDAGQDDALIHVEVDAVELTAPNEIGPHENP